MVAEVTWVGVTRSRLVVMTLATLLACARDREQRSEQKVARQRSAPPPQVVTKPLTFAGEEKWLKGSISYDNVAAQDVKNSVGLTVTLEVVDAVVATERFKGSLFEDDCVRLRFMYRRHEADPARPLQELTPHARAMWASSPLMCFYAGLQSTWRVAIVSDTEPTHSRAQYILLTSNGRRVEEEALSIVLIRATDLSRGEKEMAHSQWVRIRSSTATAER